MYICIRSGETNKNQAKLSVRKALPSWHASTSQPLSLNRITAPRTPKDFFFHHLHLFLLPFFYTLVLVLLRGSTCRRAPAQCFPIHARRQRDPSPPSSFSFRFISFRGQSFTFELLLSYQTGTFDLPNHRKFLFTWTRDRNKRQGISYSLILFNDDKLFY